MFPKAAQELLACRVSHPIFITEAKRVRQREEGRENANAKNSFLPEIIPNRQEKKKSLWGNLKPFPFKWSMEKAQEVLTKFPPPGIFIAQCKVAFSI